MSNVEIIDDKAEVRISERLVTDRADVLDSSIAELQAQIALQGLADKVEFSGARVIMDAESFKGMFSVYCVGQNRLLDEKEERIQDLKQSNNFAIAMAAKNDTSNKTLAKAEHIDRNVVASHRDLSKQIKELSETIKNNEVLSDNDVIKQLISIIKSQDKKLDDIEKVIKDLCLSTNETNTQTKIYVDFMTDELVGLKKIIEENIKSIANSYLMKHKQELDPKHHLGRKKKLSDELYKQLYKELGGNINKMKQRLANEYGIDISWQALNNKAVRFGFK